MVYELNSYINGEKNKIFFQSLLMTKENVTKIIHNHRYAEIYIVFDSKAKFLIDNKSCTFSSGTAFLIPAGTYHCCIETDENTKLIAFQTDIKSDCFLSRDISHNIISQIVSMAEKEDFIFNGAELSALLSVVANSFFPKVLIKQTQDYAAVIFEFLSDNYNREVKISELSKKLYLSDKQTTRLVKKYTGYTFKNAVANYRIKVADFLEKNTDMSKADIAVYVGYSSYSGYWKTKMRLAEEGENEE